MARFNPQDKYQLNDGTVLVVQASGIGMVDFTVRGDERYYQLPFVSFTQLLGEHGATKLRV